ncbi:MAG TPA: hypothetical protein VND89_08165 [Acidimicrobiales bacterium]|nr:hypothetical protein [Acidimicrobiales bacterium]
MTRLQRHYALNGTVAGLLAIALTMVAPTSLAFAQSTRPHSTGATASLSGVVVARNVARHTLVVSTHAHAVDTVRLSSANSARAMSLGTKVSAKVKVLGDGTFRVTSLARRGAAHVTTLRATVVRAAPRRLTLSAGGSVFAVASATSHSHDSTSKSLTSGDIVEVSVSINQSGLDETSLQQVGQTNLIELEGVLTSVTATSLVLAVDQGASTTITIPASLTLPSTIVAGNKVEVVVDYSGGTFSLVSISDDAAANASGVTSSQDGQSSNLEIEGLVVAANATSLTIQPGDSAAPMVVAVPPTIDVSTVTVGERVHARADLVNGVLTLTGLDVQSGEGDQGQSMATEVEGFVVSVSATSLVVQPGDQAPPVTLVVPPTIDVSTVTVGERVHARGELVAGVLTLTSLKVQGQEGGSTTEATQIDGSVTAVSATSLTIQPSDQAAPVVVAVPPTIDVSSIQVGDRINATAVLANGALTLTNFEVHTSDGSAGTSTLEFSGVVSAVSPLSLSITAGDNSQNVILAVPSSVDVTSVAVGDDVNVTASLVGGVLTVVSVSVNANSDS